MPVEMWGASLFKASSTCLANSSVQLSNSWRPCSLQGLSAMRMRASSSAALKAIVASAWFAVLLGSASLAASEDAGAVSVVLLLRHGNLALFCFSVPLLQSSTNVLRHRTLDCICRWDFFEHFVSIIQVFSHQFFCWRLAREVLIN